MKSPTWLSEGFDGDTYRRDGDRWARCLTAYWHICHVHCLLIPRGIGGVFVCPHCPGSRYNGEYVAVQWVATRREQVDVAIELARQLSPAIFPRGESVFDLDAGLSEVEKRMDRARRENSEAVRTMLRKAFDE